MTAHALIPLLASVIYIALSLVIIINRLWEWQHKLFLLYLSVALIWALSEFFLLSHFFMDHKILIFRIVICSGVLWVIQFYHFTRTLLKLSAGYALWLGYAFLFFLMVLTILGIAPESIIIEDGEFIRPTYGWWIWIYVAPLVLFVGHGVYLLLHRYRISNEPQERNQISYLLVAVGLMAFFGFLGITPTTLAIEYPVSHIGGLLSASVLSYAIMKHGLVSLNAVLRRSLGWMLLGAVGICSYALIMYLAQMIFDFVLPYETLVFATLTAVLVSILIYLLRPTFVTMIDFFFYRDTFSARQVLQRFDIEMNNIISLDELARQMLTVIVKALDISEAILLFQHEESRDYVTRYISPEKKKSLNRDLVFVRDNPIIKYLEKETEPINLAQIGIIVQFGGLWKAEREILAASGLGLLCPIKSRGKLVGILALSTKKDKKAYSQEDMEMIKGMAGKAGIIVENARMFDTLQQQQQQMQHLLSEAIHAQESERQRISVDLHDSVAQWLAGASYQAQTVEAMLPDENDTPIREQINLVEDTVERSLKELRRVVVDLRPPALDELGLSHALRQSLSTLSSEGIHCEFNETGTLVRLAPEVEITVYRAVQEALTNIRKHAGASKVRLQLEYKEEELVVKVQDNGKGFDLTYTLENAIAVGSIGLLGMRQRLEMLDGRIDIRTREGGGTIVTMNLPLRTEEKEESNE